MGQRELVVGAVSNNASTKRGSVIRYFFGWVCGCLLCLPLLARAEVPDWQHLTPQQQTVLAPVASKWNGMSTVQRQRLLAAAARYPSLHPDQQQRFERRLIVWSSLTQQQRDQARRNYLKLKHLPPAQQKTIKQRLLAAHPPLPAVTQPSVVPALNSAVPVPGTSVSTGSAPGVAKPIGATGSVSPVVETSAPAVDAPVTTSPAPPLVHQ